MAIEVADGVFQLAPLPYVNVVAVRGDDGWTLIDAGVPWTGGRLVSQLRALGIGNGDVERIVLTHGHLDHVGGADRVRRELGAREVLAGAADVPAIRQGANASGETPSLVARVPGGGPGYDALATVEGTDGPIPLGDERVLVPVPTPGHTDGHLAFHLPAQGVVVGGDTVFNIFRMTPSPGFLCSDAERNRGSILTIAELAPTTLLLAHGSPVTGDVEGDLRRLVSA